MDLTITLIPISLKNIEEPKRSECFKLTSMREDAEFCLNVKCRSPFAKFKVLISITNFNNEHLQATVCSQYDSVCIMNPCSQQEIIFDGFIKHDDEGVTVPFIVGPLFSLCESVVMPHVRATVDAIERLQTVLKVFINEAYLKGARTTLKKLLFSDNNESDLVNNIVNFINVDKIECSEKYVNVTKWVPAINYVTGKQLLTVLFIFKFN
ncbi:hypothetical protein [Epiphyas postvittana nucleopolyhedrovirus]|uniref:Uncharacterized protein n=2 Tax=Epiphyas postvittana nucleopolyhedrovirus TaxID=70600 RepID=Q91GN5_NPVEP|nr:hypothetical protein [Epiphyas postvittana nucleopolyhedrovirus]AAK85578.1 unknown [Epiphyas postvittana nucleopolyhedrovirus]